MKIVWLVFVVNFSCVLNAGIRIPSTVFEICELEEAREKAKKFGKPISFLYTDADSDCGLCNSAANTILRELKTTTVMVYMRDKRECPRKVAKALTQRGKYIPKVVVFDPDLTQELGLVTYEEIDEDARNAFRSVKKAISEYKKSL